MCPLSFIIVDRILPLRNTCWEKERASIHQKQGILLSGITFGSQKVIGLHLIQAGWLQAGRKYIELVPGAEWQKQHSCVFIQWEKCLKSQSPTQLKTLRTFQYYLDQSAFEISYQTQREVISTPRQVQFITWRTHLRKKHVCKLYRKYLTPVIKIIFLKTWIQLLVQIWHDGYQIHMGFFWLNKLPKMLKMLE